jgi:hypothetical protein
MAKIGSTSTTSSWQQMQVWRDKRKAAYERYQQFASTANTFVSIKSSESQSMGNIVAKVAAQRMSKKV